MLHFVVQPISVMAASLDHDDKNSVKNYFCMESCDFS